MEQRASAATAAQRPRWDSSGIRPFCITLHRLQPRRRLRVHWGRLRTFLPRRARACSTLRLAWIYLALGEIDRGFDWLEKGIEEGEGILLHLHVDPQFDPLRSHLRYPALLRKMNLEP